ncbi:Rha family transcriptional regulator [Pseudomonas anguilliseptica]|uniref:Rha family transcriptional regulator n=1 Tax=Pseudomonas anguilliseptica TaxID=53406 RepID=UPI0022B0697C|nr:Rha family transcriptional regulator [Pseudomonas anguilliseptica]MCZ4323983.1 Rha family transcriptional regulator [Pseudomonas anguilliseptica]
MNIEQIKTIGHVPTLNGLPGMSSQEIAEITGKRHKNVLRDIQKMVEEIGSNLSQCQVVDTQAPDSYGRLQPLTILDKELTFTLLSRYSFKLAHLIVKRWFELEEVGFERICVRATVARLIESDKMARAVALKALHKGPSVPISAEQKERRRLNRMVNANAAQARKKGCEWM